MACVYRHIRLDTNQPFYIGIGTKTKRAYSKHKRTSYWTNIVNKSDYEVEILFDDLTWEDACKKEKEFIALYGRIDDNTGILVNLTDGGDGSYGYKHRDEDLIKIGKKSKGRIKSPEQIRKWKESRNGFVVSDETRRKISEARKGKKHSEATIEKLKQVHTGKKLKEETKEKLRQIMLKREPYKFTPEALKKLSESHKGIKQSEETILKRKITIALKKIHKAK